MSKSFKISLQMTDDGSPTLRREDLGENYHSSKGAYTESLHVFIREGLGHYEAKARLSEPARVLEVGFGTGLNALLAWEHSKGQELGLWYEALEPYPLSPEVVGALDYASHLPQPEDALGIFQELHTTPWDQANNISPTFLLTKRQLKLEDFEGQDSTYDVVFFDAFAPQKQGELWEQAPLEKCFRLLKPGGVLTTYCAQGQFKRNLKAVGFEVERVAGPPNGKREITRAQKPLRS